MRVGGIGQTLKIVTRDGIAVFIVCVHSMLFSAIVLIHRIRVFGVCSRIAVYLTEKAEAIGLFSYVWTRSANGLLLELAVPYVLP